MRRTFTTLAAIAITLAIAHSHAAGHPPAGEILARMERTINGFRDQQMDIRLTIVDVDGSRKAYEFSIWQKGDEKRLIRFTSGEMNGMATLVESRDRVHVYLPGFKKVRRVAAHNMNQSFAGSDFSNDDMASVSWTKAYDATLDRGDSEAWHLTATPKRGAPSSYSRVTLKVDKRTGTQLEAHYFDAAGTKVKSFHNTDLTDWGGVPRARMVVVSDPRTGHRTEMELRSFKVNQNLPDDLFTIRTLQMGR